VLAARFSTERHWLLDEHRTLKGHALIPGTGYLELARAALEEHGERGPFELRDLFFFRPLHVADGEAKEVRVKLKRSEEGYSFEVRGRRMVDTRRGWELHAQAELVLHALAAPPSISPAAIKARLRAAGAGAQDQHLQLGPRWRVLRESSFGAGEALALLDVATGFALRLIEGYDPDTLWVPVSYRTLRCYAPLAGTLYSWVRNHGPNSAARDVATFDVTIADESGRVLAEIQEFAVKRVAGDTDFALASRPLPSEIEYEAGDGERQLSPAELQLQRNLRQGIRPAEGMQAFARVLSAPARPVWIVTSLDLAQLLEQAAQSVAPAADDGAKFARPELDSEYLEPRDEIERTIVGFWQELLGVERVGVQDSFFDLGGHSLIAVRLFAKIKKAYQVDYPISVLFEAPTIERCAAMIRAAIGTTAGPATEAAVPVATHRSRYTHLVPMHAGDGGPQRPFFLVAGMFGNVLNLRHLAHLIGADRPFYGLQARGLYGDHAPHETFEEMARDYLKELRTVQPHGPYFLGGFSGGGITAYEMAQQLLAEGEETALLLMLDSNVPGAPVITRRDKAMVYLRHMGPAYLAGWARKRLRWETERLLKRFGPPQEKQQSYELHNAAIEAAFRTAFARYRPASYPGGVTLFRPRLDQAYVLAPGRVLDASLQYVYHDNGWGRFAGAVEVHEVPGSHDSMVLEPNVRVVAARLRACIHKAEAAIASATSVAPRALPAEPAYAEVRAREKARVA
jgi:thioesterase domain-containing protein/acyl carrier protein